MHHIIRFIEKASSAVEARAQAEKHLIELVKQGTRSIDYGTFFDDESSTVSGPARFGKRMVVAQLDSKEGADFVLGGFAADFEDFRDKLKDVKEKIDKGVGTYELYSDSMFMYLMHSAGRADWVLYNGRFISWQDYRDYVSDQDASKLWVVPCDVHT